MKCTYCRSTATYKCAVCEAYFCNTCADSHMITFTTPDTLKPAKMVPLEN